MKNLYHSDIYKFDTPVSSYWEDTSSENLNLEKLTKDIAAAMKKDIEIVLKTNRYGDNNT